MLAVSDFSAACSVTEPAVAGYTTTYNNCSNVVIASGGSATCTITNDDVRNDQHGTLIVKKLVVNDNGGTKTASDFNFRVFPLKGCNAIPFEADGQNELVVDAVTYYVFEPFSAQTAFSKNQPTEYTVGLSSINPFGLYCQCIAAIEPKPLGET